MNLFSFCCTGPALAHPAGMEPHRLAHIVSGSHSRSHAGSDSGTAPCSLVLTDRAFLPVCAITPLPDHEPETVPAVVFLLVALFRPLPVIPRPAVHGPPRSRQALYLQTLRLRI